MAIGDVSEVEALGDGWYVDTGMFDVSEYGAVYLIDGERPALIDSGIGTDRERVLDLLDVVGVDRDDLAVILLTHVHLDHAGGAGFLAETCPNATVAVHEIGAPHVADPERLVTGTKRAVGEQWRYYVEPVPVPTDRLRSLAAGDPIDLGDRVLEVLHLPGHAPHQVGYHDADRGVVFPGDAAGIWSPSTGDLHPSTPPPDFDLEQCIADVEAMAEREPDLICHPHFGPVEADRVLDRYPDVLESWVAAVRRLRGERDRDAIVERLVDRQRPSPWGERKLRAEVRLNLDGTIRYLDQHDSTEQ